MTIYFAPTLDCLPYNAPTCPDESSDSEESDGTTEGFLYMFHTDPQPDSTNAYVKVGRTEQLLLVSRLKSYLKEDTNKRTVIPINIYYSKPDKYTIRETILKRLCTNHPLIKLVDGSEYFYGNYVVLKTLFIFVSTISNDNLQNVLTSYLLYLNPTIDNALLEIGKDKEITYIITQNNFNKKEWIKKWVKYIQTSEATCPHCNKFCNNKSGLASHIKKCKENISLECEYCHFMFSNKPNLVRHYTTCESRKKNELNESKSECEKLKIENELLKKQLAEVTNSSINDSNFRDEFKRLLEERKMLYTHIQLLEKLLNQAKSSTTD